MSSLLAHKACPINFDSPAGGLIRTMHHQRASMLAFLRDPDGVSHPCAMKLTHNRCDLQIGQLGCISLMPILRFGPVLGVASNPEESFLVTISNPSIIAFIDDTGALQCFPLGAVETEMVNIVRVHVDRQRNEICVFCGTNEGYLYEWCAPLADVLSKKRRGMQNRFSRLAHVPGSVNDIAVRWDTFGRMIAVVVTDSDCIVSLRRHGVVDGEPLSDAARNGRSCSLQKTFKVPKHIELQLGDVCPRKPSKVDFASPEPEADDDTKEIPPIVSFFTYCAWSPCGNYVSATADVDKAVMIWKFIDGNGTKDDELVPIVHFTVDVEPYAIVGFGSSGIAFTEGPFLHVYDLESGSHNRIQHEVNINGIVVGERVSPDDTRRESVFVSLEGTNTVLDYRVMDSNSKKAISLRDACSAWVTKNIPCQSRLREVSRLLSPKCPYGDPMTIVCCAELCHDRPSCQPRCQACGTTDTGDGVYGCHSCCFKVCVKCAPVYVCKSRAQRVPTPMPDGTPGSVALD